MSKKLCFFALSAAITVLSLLSFSCSRESSGGMETDRISLKVSHESGTRALIGGELPSVKIFWSPGDSIAVFGRGRAGRFLTDLKEPSGQAMFSGRLPATGPDAAKISKGMTLWAFSPYSRTVSCTDGVVRAELPGQQKAVAGSFDPGSFPMMAQSGSFSLVFRSTCSSFRLTFNEPGITRVVLSSVGGEPLSGPFTVSSDTFTAQPVARSVSGL